MKPLHIKIALTLLLAILIFSFWLYINESGPPQNLGPANLPQEYNLFPENLAALDQFVGKHYLKNGLVQTNLKSTAQTDLASGEDLLSESVGLMLLYYLKTDQEGPFEAHLKLANSLLLKDNGLYQWRYRSGQEVTVSASVDDLRIIKALLLAADKWQREDFKSEAQNLSNALLQHCVKEGQLLSYDGEGAEVAPLFYYDFKALKLLENLDSRWSKVYATGMNILAQSRNSQFPFYAETASGSGTYKMIENSLIAFYLSEVGQLPLEDLKWFKTKLKEGTIYGEYAANGQALSTIESPSIYGIIAQIGKNEHDKTLYKKAGQKLKAMQYAKKDAYYGGFYDPHTQDAYSFDQLMGLLGY